jgi:hypothetical protein
MAAMREVTGQRTGRISLNPQSAEKVASHFRNHDVGDKYFRLRLQDLGFALLMTTEPRDFNQGETPEQLQGSHSTYVRAIQSADPNAEFVKFFVWSDSFDTYLAAKEIAERRGLRGNWIPMKKNEELTELLGSGQDGSNSSEKIMWQEQGLLGGAPK